MSIVGFDNIKLSAYALRAFYFVPQLNFKAKSRSSQPFWDGCSDSFFRPVLQQALYHVSGFAEVLTKRKRQSIRYLDNKERSRRRIYCSTRAEFNFSGNLRHYSFPARSMVTEIEPYRNPENQDLAPYGTHRSDTGKGQDRFPGRFQSG